MNAFLAIAVIGYVQQARQEKDQLARNHLTFAAAQLLGMDWHTFLLL